MHITPDEIRQKLGTIMDPELNIDIVSLGLVYDISVKPVQTHDGEQHKVHIVFTLTTPGCPLSHVFEEKIRQALDEIEGLDGYRDVTIELTFDPPWIPDMMSEEARAELGF